MPQLDLTERELRLCWAILDRTDNARKSLAVTGRLWPAGDEVFASLFDKVYRAYRGMPPRAA